MKKRLYRSRTDRRISGVIGGLGEYFNVDATILRLLYLALTIFSAGLPGILVYIIAVMIVPIEPDVIVVDEDGEASL